MPFVYILECSDASYYVGSTWDLERRVGEHDLGLGAEYTRRRRPVRLVWSCQLNRVDEAFRVEKQIQGWSRAKRQALIEGRFEDLPALARTAKPRDRREGSTHGGVVSTSSTDVPTGSTDGGVVSTRLDRRLRWLDRRSHRPDPRRRGLDKLDRRLRWLDRRSHRLDR
jgi:putative endonuclease